jgi:uncharacterized delta-60 repeat protein
VNTIPAQITIRQALAFVALWALLCLSAVSLAAQTAGRVDPTFGRSLGVSGRTEHILPQPDGKILVSGLFPQSFGRLEADGRNDTSFVVDSSLVIQPFMALQPDGKIILARDKIYRLQADGTVDTSFHSGARTNWEIYGLALQSDGKVIIAGGFVTIDGQPRNRIARLYPNGDLDPSFDPGIGPNDLVKLVEQQSDGKILIAGDFASVAGVPRNRFARLNADGTLDSTFDPNNGPYCGFKVQADGKILLVRDFSSIERINSDGSTDSTFHFEPPAASGGGIILQIALQPDGKIIIPGFHLYRLNADGSFDAAYGIDQRIKNVNSVAVQADGTVLFVSDYSVYRATSAGMLDVAFVPDAVPGPNAEVYCVQPLPDGTALVGGRFTHFSGIRRNHIAKILPDGRLDTTFDVGVGPGLGGSVDSIIVQPDGKYILFGNFFSWGDTTTYFLVRLNTDGSLDSTFGPIYINGIPIGALLPDGKIMIGGNFSMIQGGERHRLARLNSDGSLDSSFNANNSIDWAQVTSITSQADGKLLVGGISYPGDGNQIARLVRLETDGGLDTGFNPGIGPSGDSSRILQIIMRPEGKILVGGSFNRYNNTSHKGVVRLNSDGSIDNAFNTSLESAFYCTSIAVQGDGKLIVGGQFQIDVTERQNLARLNPDGSTDTSFNVKAGETGTNFFVQSVALEPDGDVLIGGGFTLVNKQVRNYAARIKPDGTVDNSFNPGVGQPSVAALALQPSDGKVIVGGDFVSAGGAPANGLARLRSDGSLDPSFKPPYAEGETVQAITRRSSDGVILAANLNPSVTPSALRQTKRPNGPDAGGKVRNPIRPVRVGDGSFDTTFNNGNEAGTNGDIHVLALQGPANKILVGGKFSELNEIVGHPNIGRLNANGTIDTSFNASSNERVRVFGIQPNDSKSIIGGDFTQVNGVNMRYVARLDLDGSLDATFQPGSGPDGPVTATLIQSDGRVVIGGAFSTVQGNSRSHIARLNANGSLDGGFQTGAFTRTGGAEVQITSIAQQPGDKKLVIAGLFDFIGTTSRHNIARLNTNGSVDLSFDPATGPDAIVRALILQPDGKSLLGGDFTTVDLEARAAAARLLGDNQTVGTITSALSVSGVVQQPFIPYKITADNAPNFFIIDGLPPGLALDSTTGIISGTPTETGEHELFVAAFGNGIATATLLLKIQEPDPLAPVFTSPSSVTATAGEFFSYTIPINNPDPNAPVTYSYYGVLPDGLTFNASTGTISGTPTGNSAFRGSRSSPSLTETVLSSSVVIIVASNSHGTTTASLTINIAGAKPASQLLNIATRLRVQSGEKVLIGGFIITGTDPKRVLIRGIGPSLVQFFSGALEDPTLELFQGNTSLASNNDWKESQAEIEATGIPPTNDKESAIVRTLAPGNYTAVLRGNAGSTGVGVVEAYDLDQGANSKLANIASRGFVGTGSNVMIGGLIVGPADGASTTVVVRAVGPSLENFGIADALQDPTLDLVDSNGVVIRANDNWKQSSQHNDIAAAGLALNDDRESAVIETLNPGNYTAIVRGAGNTTGVGLVEVYHVP